MADPVTIGVLTASALSLAAEATLRGAVGDAGKDLYKAVKDKVAQWAASDVDALEKTPSSKARQAVLSEIIDNRPADDQADVRALVDRLVMTLKSDVPSNIGLDIGRLEAMNVQLGDITVTDGIGARISEAKVGETFQAGNIVVGHTPGKN